MRNLALGNTTRRQGGDRCDNQVIREVASRHKNVIFIDQKATMPADGRHFIDPCHLTAQGIDLFVHQVMEALRAKGELRLATGEKRQANRA